MEKTLKSIANEKGYHDIPQEWLEQVRHIAIDFEQYVSPSINVKASIALRGGWKVGYTWHGRVRLSFSPNVYNLRNNPPMSHKYIKLDKIGSFGKEETFIHTIAQLQKAWDSVKDRINIYEQGARIISLYRNSGIVKKKVARKISQQAKEKYGVKDQFGRVSIDYYTDKELQRFLLHKFTMRLYNSSCPHCGTGKPWSETICGWECKECGAQLNDHNKVEWCFEYASNKKAV